MITAIYLRLSNADEKITNEYDDSNSIKNQRDLLTSYIASQYDLCDSNIIEISDDGFTGTNFERPGMKRLLELVKSGDVNCIIVKDFSRFGRNYIEAGEYIEHLFPFMGVRFISVNDGYDSQKEDISAGNINVAFMNLIHDLYAKDISLKVKTAQKTKWEKGENIIGHPIFGYVRSTTDKYKIVVDEQAAAVVRQIFDMAVKGIKIRDIAKTLNESNIPTPNKYGRDFLNCKRDWKKINSAEIWTFSKIRRIITDERYTGKSICGKSRRLEVGGSKYAAVPENEWIVKDNAFKAIVSKDTFEKAQSKKKQTKKFRTPPKLKQRIIYAKIRCGSCGMALKRQAYITPSFICETPQYTHSPDCVHERISESKIEKIVFEVIRRQIDIFVERDRLRLSKTDSSKNKISLKIQELQRSIQKLTRDKISLYDRYKDEKISREDYMSEREMLTLQIDGMEKQIQELNLELLTQEKSAEREYTKFSEATELTCEMVDSVVEGIIVYSADRIEINLKYADEFNI